MQLIAKGRELPIRQVFFRDRGPWCRADKVNGCVTRIRGSGIAAMGESVNATIDVMDTKVHLKVLLPGMLGMFSGLVQAALQKKGSVLLEDHRG